ncbi:hypothetical protein L0F63_001816 [Massospora cicadina]|nr:hypothetical protein L0F63_001816 [Massospora cicadina]
MLELFGQTTEQRMDLRIIIVKLLCGAELGFSKFDTCVEPPVMNVELHPGNFILVYQS